MCIGFLQLQVLSHESLVRSFILMQSNCVLCISPLPCPLPLWKVVSICLHWLMDWRNYWFYSCYTWKTWLRMSWVCILYNLTTKLSKYLSVYSVCNRHNLAFLIIVLCKLERIQFNSAGIFFFTCKFSLSRLSCVKNNVWLRGYWTNRSSFLVYHFYTADFQSRTVFSRSNENPNNYHKAQEEEN